MMGRYDGDSEVIIKGESGNYVEVNTSIVSASGFIATIIYE